jgi:hypothetical protein
MSWLSERLQMGLQKWLLGQNMIGLRGDTILFNLLAFRQLEFVDEG